MKRSLQSTLGIVCPFWVCIRILFMYVRQFTSVAHSCPTLCDPMDCGLPGFPVQLPTTWACLNSDPRSGWIHPTISSSVVCFSSCLQCFPASGSFPMTQLFTSVAKVLKFQLQHQSFQWICRSNILKDCLVWFPCNPRDSPESMWVWINIYCAYASSFGEIEEYLWM